MSEVVKLYVKYRTQLALLGLICLLIGMAISRTMLSVSMMYLTGIALLNPHLRKDSLLFLKNKTLLILTSLYLLYLLHGIQVADTEYYLSRLRIKLPFLILPFVFNALPTLPKKSFRLLLGIFVLTVSFSAAGSLMHYVLNIEQITEAYKSAHVLATPVGHVRFSLMVAFATLTALYFWIYNWYLFIRKEQYLYGGLALFLFIFLHILAVRSGIVGFYFAAVIWCSKLMIQNKRFLIGGGGLLLVLAIPVIAYYTVPTFQNKINYARYDIKRYLQGNAPADHSDARRIVSFKIGWKLVQQAPITGVGLDNMREKVANMYEQQYPEIKSKILPHNQFLYYLAAGGIIGLTWFCLVFFTPLFTYGSQNNILFLSLYAIVFTSMLVDNTLETQIGTAFYLSFLLIFINYFKGQETTA